MSILALHGFTGCGSDFMPFAEAMGGDWHCPDLPGHGGNQATDCTPGAAISFIQKEATASDNILLGYSMGARAALLHAITHPAAWKALILISPNPGIEDSTERATRRSTDAKLAERIEDKGVAAFIEFWQQTPMIRSQRNIRKDWREKMQAARRSHTAQGLATSLRQFGQGHCPNLWPELPKLSMPVLLITGAEDQKYQRIAQDFLNRHPVSTTHAIIEGAGHMPQLENLEDTVPIVRRFLKGVRAS